MMELKSLLSGIKIFMENNSWGGAQVGALVPPPYDVVTVPLFAMAGAYGGSQGLTWLGTQVGEAVCPK